MNHAKSVHSSIAILSEEGAVTVPFPAGTKKIKIKLRDDTVDFRVGFVDKRNLSNVTTGEFVGMAAPDIVQPATGNYQTLNAGEIFWIEDVQLSDQTNLELYCGEACVFEILHWQ